MGMIFVLDAVEVVLSDDTEGSCISTEHSSEELEVVLFFLGLERDSDLRTHDFLELAIGKHDFKGFDVIEA